MAKLGNQKIEQGGVRRRWCLNPKVALGLDQARSEQSLPDPVDGDTISQWILV